MKGKMPIIIISVCVVAANGFFSRNSGGGNTGGGDPSALPTALGEVNLTCEECGKQWSQKPKVKMLCSKCDIPGYVESFFSCRKCKEEFMGVQCKKRVRDNAPMYRRTADEEWMGGLPKKLKCTACGFESKNHYANRIWN